MGRKRSRAHSMFEMPQNIVVPIKAKKTQSYEQKTENIHYPRTSSMPLVNVNAIIEKFEQISPKRPTLPQSFSKEALSLNYINEQKEDIEIDDMIAVATVEEKSEKKEEISEKKTGIWSLDRQSQKKKLLKMSKPKLIKMC